MMDRRISFALLPLLMAVVVAEATHDDYEKYVIATSVNLRENPDLNSKVLAALPIGVQVRVMHLGGSDSAPSFMTEVVGGIEWIQVAVSERLSKLNHGEFSGFYPEEKVIIGWVSAEYLYNKRPTVEFLLKEFNLTSEKDIVERRTWAERIMALDPSIELIVPAEGR